MINALKRLSLGIALIAVASAILLFADRGHRTSAVAHETLRIAIVQHANSQVLDDGVRGVMDGLRERGFRDGDRLAVQHFNAQGDMPTGIAIARQVTAGDYDLVVTSSTPSMQAVANNNREGRVRHVFTLVADPFASGVGLDRADPLKHPPHMVGQGSFPPVEKAFALARQMLPGLKRVGVAWNPAESNSLAFVARAREVTRQLGIDLLEANVDNTSAVSDAINSLIVRDAQAIWIGGDNTVIAAVDAVIAISRRMRVPVFTVLPGAPERGTLFDAGPDFYEVGKQGGALVADVLEGADLTKIPIRDVLDVVPAFLSINTTALKNLKEPWRVPAAALEEANVVVDETGVHRKASRSAKAAGVPPLSRKWRLQLVQLTRIVDVEEAEKGVLDGLKEAGLVEGRDYEKTVRDAQGDMATLSALIDAAITAGADMLITFSTPTLQAALQRARQVPIVFNYISDPIVAGAGTSDASHLPNVTGVYLVGAYDKVIPVLRAYLPKVRVVGTVFNPAEVNMVAQRDVMSRIMREAGIEVKAVAANTSAEVGDAALALVANRVDAIVQIPGNLTAQAFPSLSQAAMRGRVPVFAFQSSQARGGSVAVVARDYYDSGREAAAIAARVMRGESPASIPFAGVAKTTLIVNQAAAKAIGIATPPSILSKAEQVIEN